MLQAVWKNKSQWGTEMLLVTFASITARVLLGGILVPVGGGIVAFVVAYRS